MVFLVLGSRSFLSREYCQQLQNRGHIVLESSRSGSALDLDIFDLDRFKFALEALKPDYVINFAWITKLHEYEESEMNWRYSDASINLLQTLAQFDGISYIGIGSGSEYGLEGEFSASYSTLNPRTTYAKAKVKTYEELRAESNNSGVKFYWARVFQPYGKRQDSSRLIPQLINSIKCKSTFLINSPHREVDWIHSEDVASGLITGVEAQIETFDLGTTRSISNIEICEFLKDNFGLKYSLVEGANQESSYLRVSKDSPLFTLTNWSPRIDLFSKLSEMVRI
jgi:nucleoside-diphosphate-sugar epimerase